MAEKEEEKVTNLCEDLKPHVHDEKGYEVLKTAEDKDQKNDQKKDDK